VQVAFRAPLRVSSYSLDWATRVRLNRPVPLLITLGLTAAAAGGWAIGRGSSLLPLGAAMLVPVAAFGPRARPVHWLITWLAVAGLTAFAPGAALPGGLPELTAERLMLVLVVAFTASHYVLVTGSLWLWPVLFSVDYILMAVFTSPDVREALLTFIHHYVPAFVIFLVAASGLSTPSVRATLFRGTAIIGGAIAAVALAQPALGLDFGVDANAWSGRIAGTLESPPVLGASLACLLCLGLSPLLAGTPRWRTIGAGTCALMLLGVLFTFTRAAWFSVLMGLALVGLVAIRRRPLLAAILLGGVVAAIVFGPTFAETLSNDPRLQDDTNLVGRLETSVLSWQLFLDRPIFGWGPLVVNRFDASTGYDDWVSHDSFLTLLDATGMLGTAFYFVPVLIALGRGIHTILREEAPLRSGTIYAFAGAIVYIVNALAIDMRYFSYPHALFWLCLGILIAPRSPPARDLAT
jgi:O-antigen ligase